MNTMIGIPRIRFAGVEIKPLFAWYDLWVGIYIDVDGRKLYILPLPMCGIVVEFLED